MRSVSPPGAYLLMALIMGGASSGYASSPSPPSNRIYLEEAAPEQEIPCCGAQVQFQATYDAQYYCGSTSLANHTLTNSPLLADCQAMLANATGMPGYWTLSHWPGDQVLSPMLTNGTCQLVVGKMGSDLGLNAT
ncbi:hypothetical protein PG994_003512 [Apiospora phragmitis]|uniref:Ecp2 effector protein-like domain-containing protein n=1 Tax=Apiospora phragmitis TaxID=2905665 RepID=A0ABR1VYC7_9PEZI